MVADQIKVAEWYRSFGITGHNFKIIGWKSNKYEKTSVVVSKHHHDDVEQDFQSLMEVSFDSESGDKAHSERPTGPSADFSKETPARKNYLPSGND